MACAPTRTTDSRWGPSASRASSKTRRARTYSGSTAPGILVPRHPLDHLLTLSGPPSGSGEEICGQLRRSRVCDAVDLLCTVEHHVIERLGQEDVRACLDLAQSERLGGTSDVVDVCGCHSSGCRRSELLSRP